MKNIKNIRWALLSVVVAGLLITVSIYSPTVRADSPSTASGAVGLEGVIPGNPPAKGATISVPGNGAVFTTLPVTVSGLCPNKLLVKIFSNNIFVGSIICNNGSYSIPVDLFSGQNSLVAIVYDALDQAGPPSNTVNVTFQDAQFIQFGNHVELSSTFAEKGAPPNTELDWPISITGGTAPYAISIDWGDGSAAQLLSAKSAGNINLNHIYKVSGIYNIVIKATDVNGETAFLQLVGQATGAIQSNTKGSGNTVIIQKIILWWPALVILPLIVIAFYLGGRNQIYIRRKEFEKVTNMEAESRRRATKT